MVHEREMKMNKLSVNSLLKMDMQNELNKMEACNSYTKKFGLELSKDEIAGLMQERFDALNRSGRIELAGGILDKLIFEFCDSAFIWQDNYVLILSQLQEMFYYFKNESLDEISDDELIQFMKNYFEGECQGSIEYMQETKLEDMCRAIREGKEAYHPLDEDNVDYDEPLTDAYGYEEEE